MAENPVLTSKEPDVDVVIFGNTFEIEESTNAQVDKALNISLISKAMIKRLRADPKPCHQGTLKDSTGKTYQPIGKVDLLWHRVTALRSNEQTFFVVDLSGPDVIFGADAITSEDPSNIHTLGLDNQNAGMSRDLIQQNIYQQLTRIL